MSIDPATVAELDRALVALTDDELAALVARIHAVAGVFLDAGRPRVADVFAALCVLGAEHQDHRRDLAEHARVELDGDEIGGRLSQADLDQLPMLDELFGQLDDGDGA